nr:transposon Ty3-I Gag-Pol polyprotein [Ipomoea batatas]
MNGGGINPAGHPRQNQPMEGAIPRQAQHPPRRYNFSEQMDDSDDEDTTSHNYPAQQREYYIPKTPEQQTARYLNGLGFNIRERMALAPVWTVDEAYNMALRAEELLSQATSRKQSMAAPTRNTTEANSQRTAPNQNFVPSLSNNSQEAVGNNSKFQRKKGGEISSKGIAPNPYARPMTGKCFKCGEPGHRSNECRATKYVNMVEEQDEFDEEGDINEGEVEDCQLSLTRQPYKLGWDKGSDICYGDGGLPRAGFHWEKLSRHRDLPKEKHVLSPYTANWKEFIAEAKEFKTILLVVAKERDSQYFVPDELSSLLKEFSEVLQPEEAS